MNYENIKSAGIHGPLDHRRRATRDEFVTRLAESIEKLRTKHELKRDGKGKHVHVILGKGILESLAERGEQIVYVGGSLHRYRGGLWEALNAEQEKTWLSTWVQEGCNSLELTSRNNVVNEVRGWIARQPELHREKINWDSHGKIPTLSGLMDPKTGEVTPLRPEHYATYRIECLYDPEATCPWWEQMLKDCFPDKATIDVIQEVLGTALIENKPRELTRALVLVGPSNSGKSNLLNAMAGFLSDQAITASFDGLDNTHGLMPFLRRAPWLLHEAFEQSKWHFSATVKALLSGDPVAVNIKSGPIVTHRFRSPVLWGSNSRPQFKEASKAMTKRMIVQPCTNVFSDEKPVGAAKEAYERGYSGPADLVLDTERSGILNWALAGLKGALARGHFDLTPEMKATLHEIQREANYIEGFMEECIEYDETKRISMANLCAAHGAWWKSNHGNARPMPSNDAIGRALRDLGDPKLKFQKSGSRRYIIGIKLNKDGGAHWEAALTCKSFEFGMSKTSNISATLEDVEQDATD
jgi:putative DNA primase/helicase